MLRGKKMSEKHEKSSATQVVLYFEQFGAPRFELVLPPQRQSIFKGSCSLFLVQKGSPPR